MIYWIGGGSGAGKSTVARRLAAEYGWAVYHTDDVMPEHARRSTPREAPYLHAFMAMTMDERWVDRSPETMLETFHWFRGEAFDLILDDLRKLPGDRPVVAEGFRLLPHLVGPERAVWLLPTPAFRRQALESRGSLWSIAGRTSNPERALANLLERDRLFTDRLRQETARRGLPVVEIEVGMSQDEVAERAVAAMRPAARP
ncbi:hypothetical protein ACIBG8_06400 [Nonomuraea sp. NPDC050556]|uniref:hypothetical protein n=1 Tax=Nonomuraea sp. NPDC050556 TaxID=3364369 RepID=UPI00379894F7